MIKYICDECSSTIEVYYLRLELEGEILHFCDESCMEDYLNNFLKDHSRYEDITGDNYEE